MKHFCVRTVSLFHAVRVVNRPEVYQVQMFVTTVGSGKATIVLVHPAGLSGGDMAPLADALHAKRCVRVYSRVGWDGGRPTARNSYYNTQGKQLVEVLRAETTPAHLFGWSSGGFVALHAVLEAPELVERLHLYEVPFLSRRDNDGRRHQFLAMLAWRCLGRNRNSRAAFWRMVSCRETGPTGFELLPAATRDWLMRQPGPLLEEVLAGTGEELRGKLDQIKRPVCIMTGTASSRVTHTAGHRLSEAIRSSARQSVAGADHLAPLTMPHAVAESILRTSDR